MAISRAFTKQNIREISGWKNNCLSACMADYFAEELLANRASDETVAAVGDLVGRFYGVKSLTRQDLTQLCNAFPTSIDRQVIFGSVFSDFVRKQCRGNPLENKGVISEAKYTAGQMSPKAFEIIAKQIKVNVDFYEDDGEEVKQYPSAIGLPLMSKLAVDDFQSIRESKSKSDTVLTVVYKPGHYDRLMDSSDAKRLNKQDEKNSFALKTMAERDDVNALKIQVKEKLDRIQRQAQPKKASASPSSSHDVLEQLQKNVGIDEDKKFEELLKSVPQSATNNDGKKQAYDLMYTGKPGTIFVSADIREKLDLQLAKMLQQEEIKNHRRPK